MSGIWFKDQDGHDTVLCTYSKENGEEKASIEDIARALSAMTHQELEQLVDEYIELGVEFTKAGGEDGPGIPVVLAARK